MALLFMDGFDTYGSWTDMTEASWAKYNNADIQTGRWGGNCVRPYGNDSYVQRNVSAGDADFGFQASFYVDDVSDASSDRLLGVWNNSDSNPCFEIQLVSNGSLYLLNSSLGIEAQSSICVYDTTWHYMEVWATISGEVPSGHVTVKIDGVTVLDEDMNTQGSSGNVDSVRIGSGSSGSDGTRWDDVVIMDGTGSQMNALLGRDRRIVALVPDADTAQEDFSCSSGSDSYAMLDDTIPGDHDSDSSYIYSTTLGHITRCELEDLSIEVSTVHAIALITVMREAGGNMNARPLIRSNGTDSNGTNQTELISSFLPYKDYWELDPDGAVAWDADSVSVLEIGVEVTGSGGTLQVTRSCVEVLLASESNTPQMFVIT